ncbi:arylamine N-acetyltransferase family protein [Cellulomonas alba]|uniref:Arylamine N-acetyltransferase n=1 Tax=Cellulomonas alba TaxID=3053467 RepID=A0ABT7SE10_9CELL|nr:arylamine N-acetyltransferase [Cellulomonas alba]MDM7854413.1 arylamine N-acetyltransferase [Cellulomonas alba]
MAARDVAGSDGAAWDVAALDLDAYLARIGAQRPSAPDLAALTHVHRAHALTVPFENLDVLLGRGVSVALPDVQAKLVVARRGGYCYEHGLLLSAALSALGFAVTRRLARIGDPEVVARGRSHLVTLVELDGRAWLADTGFGSGLLEPVPLVDGLVTEQGGWAFRTVLGLDGGWRLQERSHEGSWSTHYTVPDEQTFPVDVEHANHVTSTSPHSRFVGQVVVQRKDDERARLLVGNRYTVLTPDAPPEHRVVAPEELGGLLAELGLLLTPDEIAVLVALPPRDA